MGNPLNPSNDHDPNHEGEEQSHDRLNDQGAANEPNVGGNPVLLPTVRQYGQKPIHDRVGLHRATDAKGSQSREEREQHTQPFLMQPILQIVHRAARGASIGVNRPVAQRQRTTGEFRRHAHQGGHPHPEHRPGSAQGDGGRHPGDIARPDRSGQSRAKGLKMRDVPLFLRIVELPADAQQGVFEIPDLNETQPERQINPGPHQQDDHCGTPDNPVDPIHQSIEIHRFSPHS